MVGKSINNRFDEYEISSVFEEATTEHLDANYEKFQGRFWFKCILGTLLAINAYLSHWGPIPWPKNYWQLVFSIVFYQIGSYVYSQIGVIVATDGNQIGEYLFNKAKTVFLIRISSDKLEYILELVDSTTKETIKKKHFRYTEYFTYKGIFLEQLYKKHLTGFLKAN